MKDALEIDSVLGLVDTVIADLAVRPARYVGRRAQDGDAETFVIQDGEEGRLRLALPDLSSPSSVIAMAQAAQSYLCSELGEPVPRCPLHDHPLGLVVVDGALSGSAVTAGGGARWATTPRKHGRTSTAGSRRGSLPRVARREIIGVRSIGVSENESGQVATFGVAELLPELVAALQDAAAPLSVEVNEEHGPVPRRVSAPARTRKETGPATPEPPAPDDAATPDATVRVELAERSVRRGGELHFAVVNDGMTPALIGVEYGLERRTDRGWKAIDLGCWFPAVGLIIDPGLRRKLVAKIPARAVPGSYRLRKSVRVARSADGRAGGPARTISALN